jgi:hypothetical protein
VRKAAVTLILTGALFGSFVAVGLAMSEHWITGTGELGYPTCSASLDDMNPELQNPSHWVSVQLFAPNGDFLGYEAQGRLNGNFVTAAFGARVFYPGTYHCHAIYHEEWSGGSEDDTMDFYFNM